MRELLDRVPGLGDTRKLRRLVDELSPVIVQQTYYETHAARVDGYARDEAALLVARLERAAAEQAEARAACARAFGPDAVRRGPHRALGAPAAAPSAPQRVGPPTQLEASSRSA